MTRKPTECVRAVEQHGGERGIKDTPPRTRGCGGGEVGEGPGGGRWEKVRYTTAAIAARARRTPRSGPGASALKRRGTVQQERVLCQMPRACCLTAHFCCLHFGSCNCDDAAWRFAIQQYHAPLLLLRCFGRRLRVPFAARRTTGTRPLRLCCSGAALARWRAAGFALWWCFRLGGGCTGRGAGGGSRRAGIPGFAHSPVGKIIRARANKSRVGCCARKKKKTGGGGVCFAAKPRFFALKKPVLRSKGPQKTFALTRQKQFTARKKNQSFSIPPRVE